MSSTNEYQSREAQLNELLFNWYQKIGPSIEELAILEKRVEAATKLLLGIKA
jgi:hypothetical protein